MQWLTIEYKYYQNYKYNLRNNVNNGERYAKFQQSVNFNNIKVLKE